MNNFESTKIDQKSRSHDVNGTDSKHFGISSHFATTKSSIQNECESDFYESDYYNKFRNDVLENAQRLLRELGVDFIDEPDGTFSGFM